MSDIETSLDQVNLAFGERLIVLRLRLKVSVDAFAKQIGTSPELLRAWECGRGWPDPKVQEKISAADGVYSRRLLSKYEASLLVFQPPPPVGYRSPKELADRFEVWRQGLSAFRMDAGLTVQDVAKRVVVRHLNKQTQQWEERAVSSEAVSRWEKGTNSPRHTILLQLNAIFDGLVNVVPPIYPKRRNTKARRQTNGTALPVVKPLPVPPPASRPSSLTRPAAKPPEAPSTYQGAIKVRPDSIEIPMIGDPARLADLAIGLWKALRDL